MREAGEAQSEEGFDHLIGCYAQILSAGFLYLPVRRSLWINAHSHPNRGRSPPPNDVADAILTASRLTTVLDPLESPRHHFHHLQECFPKIRAGGGTQSNDDGRANKLSADRYLLVWRAGCNRSLKSTLNFLQPYGDPKFWSSALSMVQESRGRPEWQVICHWPALRP